MDLNGALSQLRKDGATPVEAILAVRDATNVSLGEAKHQFAQCPAWSDEVKNADQLHQQIERALKDL
jgi:hypothetical protein